MAASSSPQSEQILREKWKCSRLSARNLMSRGRPSSSTGNSRLQSTALSLSSVIIGHGGGGAEFVGGSGASGPAGSGGGAAVEAPQAEEKKEEKEERNDDMGFSLFNQGFDPFGGQKIGSVEDYFPLKMKRKDCDDVNDKFSGTSLRACARKIRRLDTELPPIVEEEEFEISMMFKPSVPRKQSFSSNLGGLEIEESPSQDEKKAIVLFKPMENPLLKSPSNFSVSAAPHFNLGLKRDNNESPRSHTIANAPKGTGIYSNMKLKEDMEQDDEALFDTDEESVSVLNDQSLSEACMMTSTFDSHVNYKLSSREADELLKTKWSYTWKMPALNMKNCNWRGTGECCIKDLGMTSSYGLKTKLYKNWMEIFKASARSGFHQSKQQMFFSLCNSYHDIMHHNKKPFYLKGLEEDSNIMDGYLMHSLNHVLRSRDLMSKNDRKLAKHQENVEGKSLHAEAYLDRGFTRPKVLILLPLAGIARRVIKKLIQLTPPKLKNKVENVQRFYEEFGSGITKDKDDQDDSENTKAKMSTKPSDFEALLGGDNNNDHFMIGVKFTNRGIKLYGDFYTSDILVASPLGLITKIGEAEVNKEKDVDYLSSIEILIIDHADVMLMQNWSHVKTVVEQLNKLPSKQRGTDIMRIRPWYLDGQARFYRQTIILSSHINPDFNALFHQHCFNYQGKVKLECKYRGVLPKILTQVQQIYERFDTESITGADDSRLEYFSKQVFPKIKDSVQHGVMIFVSSYFEFVRLRNYLKSQAASFCLFGEYIKPNDISHVRGQFFRGEKRIMLYTERAHFYYRYKIRGVKNLLIYSLPERKEFYSEIVNFLEPSADMNCTILFSRLDYLRLERVVGSTAAKRMVDSDKGVFVFA